MEGNIVHSPVGASNSSLEGSHSATSSAGLKEDDCFVVVECCSPFRIRQAAPKWLQLFGFRSVEIIGRSLRICFGPETNAPAVEGMLQQLASGEETPGMWTLVHLHDKTGDAVEIRLETRRELGCDTSEIMARLIMQCDDFVHSPHISSSEEATLTVAGHEPYDVVAHNQAFLDLYKLSADEFREGGISLIWGPGTDGRRWKSLIHQALGGAQKMCTLSTYDSEGDEIVVHVTMKPHDAAGFSDSFLRKGRPLQVMASLVPRSPSAASTVENKHGRRLSPFPHSRDDTSSPCSADISLQSHLKAMRLHKQQQLQHNKSYQSTSQEDRRKQELKALTVSGSHAKTFTFGQKHH